MPAISSRPCSRARRRRNVLSLRGDDMMRATERCPREIMIQFDHVGKRYAGGHEALRDVSFHVARGEMIFLTGHSGAGKSTLLKLIALIERPSSGEVIVNDRNLNRLERRQIPFHRRSLGMIFQDFRLLQDRTIFDNVALPLVIAGGPCNTAASLRAWWRRRREAARDGGGRAAGGDTAARALAARSRKLRGTPRACLIGEPRSIAARAALDRDDRGGHRHRSRSARVFLCGAEQRRGPHRGVAGGDGADLAVSQTRTQRGAGPRARGATAPLARGREGAIHLAATGPAGVRAIIRFARRAGLFVRF